MYDLPAELQEALTGYKDPYARHRDAPEVLEDWEPIFAALRELHQAHPGWRLGQTVANLTFWAAETADGNVYDVPDGGLLASAKSHLATCQAKAASPGG